VTRPRVIRAVVALACVTALAACGGPSYDDGAVFTAEAASDVPTHLAETVERLEAGASAKVIIRLAAGQGDDFEARFGDRLTRMKRLPLATLRLDTLKDLERALESVDGARLEADLPHRKTLSSTLPFIDQPVPVGSGITGAGITVAVLDSGGDHTRSAFGSCTAPGQPASCRVVANVDIAPNDGTLDDGTLHGTNVGAVVAGTAPEVDIAFLDVFTGETAWSTDIIAAVDWVLDNAATYNIKVINMSLGGGEFASPCGFSFVSDMVNALDAAGILPIAAAGNDSYNGALASPACAPGVMSVGAVYDKASPGFGYSNCTDLNVVPDQPTCFSNVASFLDLYAPGVQVTAGGVTKAGTSQASPHVAGAAALFFDSAPAATTNDARAFLTNSPTTIVDSRIGLSFPRLDLSTLEVEPPDPDPIGGAVVVEEGRSLTGELTVAVTLLTYGGNPALSACVSNTPACNGTSVALPGPTTELEWQLTPGSGPKTVHVWFFDAVGEVLFQTAPIVADVTPPSPGEVWLEGTTVFWDGFADAHTEVLGYQVFPDPPEPGECAVIGGFSQPGGASGSFTLPPGTTTATVCAYDRFGHATGVFVAP